MSATAITSAEGLSTPVPLTASNYRHLHHGTASKTPRAAELTKTPGGTVSKVTFNDDEAERRERRLHSNLATVLSPGCHTPRSATLSSGKRGRQGAESVTTSLTNTQIKEHYANCIKLSTQNKINSKNAFGLHLIDHMLQLLTIQGEMTNFQVASSTLDASAKIYAGRVDSIYTDAFKVLTGFGRETHNEETQSVEGGEENAQSAKVMGKSKSGPSVIEKNIKNLNSNKLELEYQIDPLFRKTSAAFDEGGVEGLLINHLHTGAGCMLSLDADEIPTYEDHPCTDGMELVTADIKKVISAELVRSRQLCPTFVNLFMEEDEENGWSMEQTTSNVSKTSSSHTTDIGAEYSMLPCPPLAPDVPTHDDDDGLDAGPAHDTMMGPELTNLTVIGSDNKMAGFLPTIDPLSAAESGDAEGTGGKLVLSEAPDYTYFEPLVLAAWAGPKHWKVHHKNSNLEKEEKRSKKKKQSPAQFSVDFSATPDESLLSTSKASTQLTKAVLAKRNSAHTTLPERPNTQPDVLHKLFTRPKWQVKRRRGKSAQVHVEENLEGGWYDYGNLHDNTNFCPQLEDSYDDPDGGVGVDTDTGFPLSQDVDPLTQTQDDQGSQPLQELELAGDNLVPQPRKIEKIHIEYAKTAKRLDVKKLKRKMWNLINPGESVEEGEEVAEEVASHVDNKVAFSSLCSELPSGLTAEMKRNISVPICFVCLLHLANEKCLDIRGGAGDDLSDLEISIQKQLTTLSITSSTT